MNDKEENMVNIMLYILKKIGGYGNAITVFNILYIADKRHLSRYGHLIAEEGYSATFDGPAPVTGLKIIGNLIIEKLRYEGFFVLDNNLGVCAKLMSEVDMDCISKSEADCMDEAIAEYRQSISDSAYRRTVLGEKMDILQIAEAAGANKVMIGYIMDNHNIKLV